MGGLTSPLQDNTLADEEKTPIQPQKKPLFLKKKKIEKEGRGL